MKYKIVTDSLCPSLGLNDIDYTVVSSTTKGDELNTYTESSNPSIEQWIDAFGDADIIFGVTITKNFSENFNTARLAKNIYEKQYPNRKVFIFDSLSAGPELTLIVRKIAQLIHLKKSYKEIRNTVMDYMQHTHLLFSLSNVNNFIHKDLITPKMLKKSNGQYTHIIGRASFDGKFEPTRLCHGQKRAIKKLLEQIKSAGYNGGQIIIAHMQNEKSAISLAELLKKTYGNIHIDITPNAGLGNDHLEIGSLFVGFEC